MAKYRKRPLVVEAEQYSLDRHVAEGYVPNGVVKHFFTDEEGVRHERLPKIETLEGELIVTDGDWIITGIKGEHYPCKPDIFLATYELVEEL